MNEENGFDTTFENLKKDFARFKEQGMRKSLFKTKNNEKALSLNIIAVNEAQDRMCLG